MGGEESNPQEAPIGVDAVYVINLDRSADRMAWMAKQCSDLGLACERVPAVDGASLSAEDLKALATPFCRNFCTASTIGCALSHMKVWRRVAEEGHPCTLIMEDDAELVPAFKAGLEQALRDVPPDYDILLLGCFFLCDKNRDYAWLHKLSRVFSPLRNDKRTWGSVFVPELFAGTHCYLVSQKGCQKLLNLIPKANYHIDMQMNHPALNVYAVSPDLAFQRNMSDSTIASYAFPKTLVPVMETAKDAKRISLAYYLDAPMVQVGGQKINGWTLIFLGLGLLRGRILPYVVGFMLAEFVVGGDIFLPVAAFAVGWGVRSGAAGVLGRLK